MVPIGLFDKKGNNLNRAIIDEDLHCPIPKEDVDFMESLPLGYIKEFVDSINTSFKYKSKLDLEDQPTSNHS